MTGNPVVLGDKGKKCLGYEVVGCWWGVAGDGLWIEFSFQ